MSKSGPVVVIGHVDHGKTALVRALTGVETDRLKEEKQRGLSIALGYAHRAYPSGIVDFIDAPGHEDFIRTMVAGATGARAALLVIAADEGIKAQTLEHLEIAAHLGVTTGVLALTKADLVPGEHRAAVERHIAASVCTAGFSPSDTVFCSARTGEGLDTLHAALDRLVGTADKPSVMGGFFLPVDRIFSAHGAGTVVTGTLLGGDLEVEADVEIGGKLKATVRHLQIHGAEVSCAHPGQRVAVNLRGVAADVIQRGDVVRVPGLFPASAHLHVSIRLSKNQAASLKHAESVRVLFGTSSEVASVRLLDTKRLLPGEIGFAGLRFVAPVVAHAGQCMILRRLSPAQTVGGAIVLDPAPPPARRRDPGLIETLRAADREDVPSITRTLAQRGKGAFSLDDLVRLTRGLPDAARVPLNGSLVDLGDALRAHRADADAARKMLEDALTDYHAAFPTKIAAPLGPIRTALKDRFHPALIGWAERTLVEDGVVTIRGGNAALTARDPFDALQEDQKAALLTLEAALRDGAAAPPDKAELEAMVPDGSDLLDMLVETGRAVSLYNYALKRSVVFHREALEMAAETLRQSFPPPCVFKTGEARAVLGTSRKFIVPMLEYFDAECVTVRDGDLRQLPEATD